MHLTQAMSPSLDQNLPQASTRDPPPEDTYHQTKEHECKEETPIPKPEQEQFDVKEEPESPDLGEAGTPQASQLHRSGPLTRCIIYAIRIQEEAHVKLLGPGP